MVAEGLLWGASSSPFRLEGGRLTLAFAVAFTHMYSCHSGQ